MQIPYQIETAGAKINEHEAHAPTFAAWMSINSQWKLR